MVIFWYVLAKQKISGLLTRYGFQALGGVWMQLRYLYAK